MPDIHEDPKGVIETYKGNRKLTLDMLKQLSEAECERVWPRPGLNTFGSHFAELAGVHRVFANAIETGKVDFSSVPSTFPKKSKAQLLEDLLREDTHLEECAKRADPNKLIDWGDGTRVSVSSHLINVIAHEVFHQGMMAMAAYTLGIKLPQSWIEAWAMPQTEGPVRE